MNCPHTYATRRQCPECHGADIEAAKDSEIEALRAQVAALQDEQRLLDGVVRVLGIEDDSITPAEEAARILAENEALRAQVADKDCAVAMLAAQTRAKFDLLGEVLTLKAKLADCQAEAEGLRADAERYRWLREQDWTLKTLVVVHPKDAHLGGQTYTHELLDQTIDKRRES